MAISIDTAPAAFCAASNPVWYRFSTDNYYTAEVLPYFEIKFTTTGPVANGQTLRMTPAGKPEMVFTAIETLADPVPTIWEFTHNGTLATDIHTWSQILLKQLLRNHILTSYYTLKLTQNFDDSEATLRFTVKDGQPYDDVTNALSNAVLTESNVYTAPVVAQENFSMVVELWAEENWRTGDFALINTYQLPPDTDNLASIDVRKELRTVLRIAPPSSLVSISKANGPMARFFVKYRERYGDPPVDQTQTDETAVHAAILAGARWEKHFAATLLGDLEAKYLTHQPKIKRVSTAQKEFLYFYNHTVDTVQVTVDVTAYFTDGTNQTQEMIAPSATHEQAQYGIWCIPAGYTQLNVGTINPAKTVYRYDVKAEYGATIMETFTFYVDQVAPEQERIFAIPNSLGAMDILAATGYQSRNLKRTQELIEKNPLFGTVATDAMIATLRDDHDRVMEVSAGPFDPEAQKWLEDLFLTHGQAYELVESIWVPVILLDSDLELLNENEDLKTLSFSYQYAYHTENYQP